MRPQLGDDVAGLLGPPHRAELERWTQGTGKKLRYAGWQAQGYTTARLIAAFAGRRAEQKLILKYVPMGRRETNEAARHAEALDDSPDDFRKQHLVNQQWDPVMLSGGGWILFQEIAARDLSKVRPMSVLLDAATTTSSSPTDLAKATAAAVAAILGEWNPRVGAQILSTGDHLEGLLGSRLKPGHPLCDWAYARGLVHGVSPVPAASGVDELPNPFALALGPHPVRARQVYVMYGRAHGDLHPGNILFGLHPGEFWLIDLSRFRGAAPLTYDPVHLLLTITAHFLPAIADDLRPAVIDLVLNSDVHENPSLPQPLQRLASTIHATAESWADETSRAQEWRTATLLSLVAGGLIMCGRELISDRDREWFLRLSAAAADRYVALEAQTPAPPSPHGCTTSPAPAPRRAIMAQPRMVAADRASLRAQTLPTMPRARLLDLALDRRRQQSQISGREQALMLTGEGGIGKSVLLGQLLNRIEGAGDQAVVLVPCGNVTSGLALSDMSAVDAALGGAADESLGRGGLLDLLSAERATYGSVVLLVDTLDLLLTEESAASLAAFIVEALRLSDVVITCRADEFNDYLRPIPRVADRLTTYPLPVLSEPEIVEWARTYLRNQEGRGDDSSFLASLAGSISSSGSLRKVCSLPVRLALACQVFGDEGHLPEDLSVTGLYQAYWETRVRRHAGVVGTKGRAKESAALWMASQVITASGRIALRVPKAADDVDRHQIGVGLLASEGVLRGQPTGWEFFHQTFAEFAYARWVLTHGIDSAQLNELVERATTGWANLWPAIGSVLLQISDYDDYRAVARMLPMTSVDAARTRVLGALQRREPGALVQVLSDLAGRDELLPVALAALGQAPDWHVPVAFERALDALRRHPEAVVSAVVNAVAELVPRAATGPDLVRRAVIDLSSLGSELSEARRESYLERIVQPLATQPSSADKLAVLRETYPRLGQMGRREAIRAHLRHAGSAEECVAIARIAIQHRCPPFDDSELVAILRVLWDSPDERARLGWSTWSEVLADSLPKDWDNAQLKLIVDMATDDDEVAGELVDALLRNDVPAPQRYVNAFAQIAVDRAAWTMGRVLASGVPATRLAINAMSKCAPAVASRLDRTTRTRVIDWLMPGRTANPRMTWPAQVMLAAGDIDTHRTLMGELLATNPETAVLAGFARAHFYHSPLPVLIQLADELRALVDRIQESGKATASEVLQTRARLEGRLAEADQRARHWIDAQLGADASPSVAGTVAKTIVETHSAGPPTSMVAWLGALLRTPHTDAAERLTAMLRDSSALLKETSVDLLAELASTAIDRMQTAVEHYEDSRLHRSLLNLLVRIDDACPLGEQEVWETYRIVRSRLLAADGAPSGAAASDYPAAIRDLSTLTSTLISRRLDAGTVRDMITEILAELDPTRLGTKIWTDITSLLNGLARRDPDAPEWLTVLFGMPGVALEVQLSIAEALLQFEGEMPGGRAAALKDHPLCPIEVAALIVTRLRI